MTYEQDIAAYRIKQEVDKRDYDLRVKKINFKMKHCEDCKVDKWPNTGPCSVHQKELDFLEAM